MARRLPFIVLALAAVAVGRRAGAAPRPRAVALHRLRRGRGARAAQRGHRARASRCAFGEGDPVPAGARRSRGSTTATSRRRSPRSEPRSRVHRRADPTPGGAGRAHREHLATRRRARGRRSCARPRPPPSLAERTLARERELVRTGASTAQLLDEAARGARPGPERRSTAPARCSPAPRPRSGTIAVARQQRRGAARGSASSAAAQLAELEVTAAKFHDPRAAVPTVVQTQLIWPGELAQPGTPHRSRCSIPPTSTCRSTCRCRRRPRARRHARRDRARQRARPPRAGRGQLRRRPGELHAREDRDAQRPARPGVPRQGAHPRGRRALPARAPRATCTLGGGTSARTRR